MQLLVQLLMQLLGQLLGRSDNSEVWLVRRLRDSLEGDELQVLEVNDPGLDAVFPVRHVSYLTLLLLIGRVSTWSRKPHDRSYVEEDLHPLSHLSRKLRTSDIIGGLSPSQCSNLGGD